MKKPGSREQRQTGQRERKQQQQCDYISLTLEDHLAAFASLETVEQFACYLFHRSQTRAMQKQLLEHVPRKIRGYVWVSVREKHRRQKNGGW